MATPLDEIPLVDHHAHAVLRRVPTLDEFRGLFSESPHPAQWPHVATSLTYRRMLAEVAAVLDVEPREQAVYEARAALSPATYARLLMEPTNTAWLLLDDGFPPVDEGFSLGEMTGFAGASGAPVMRLERVAEEALDGTLDALRDHVRGAVAGAGAAGAVGLKTIAAYRSGLAVGAPDPAAAAHALRSARRRLAAKPLLDLLLWDALEANEQAADPLPLQVHAGFGDSDLRLPLADPTYLAPLIERFARTPFVLLHCYPFVREAGWLAHVYPNVYLDVSLTVPHVSRPAEMVREALELAPASKLLYASDAARTPELYLCAARWFREALVEALPARELDELAPLVLRDNALGLYRLDPLGSRR